MARRKRASMREGPLADLFRSTVRPEDPPEHTGPPAREEETGVLPQQPPAEREDAPDPGGEFFDRETEIAPQPEPEHVSPERPVPPVAETPDPQRVHAYRVEEEPSTAPPGAKDRLSRILTEEAPAPEGP